MLPDPWQRAGEPVGVADVTDHAGPLEPGRIDLAAPIEAPQRRGTVGRRAQRVEHQVGGERADVGDVAVYLAERPEYVEGQLLEPSAERVGLLHRKPRPRLTFDLGTQLGHAGLLTGRRIFCRDSTGTPAGDLAGHHPAQPQDLRVPRVEHRLDDVHGGMDGGLKIGGDAVAQETAAQRAAEPLGRDGQQIRGVFMRTGVRGGKARLARRGGRVRAAGRARRPVAGVTSGEVPPGTANSGVMTPGCGPALAAADFPAVGSGSIGVTFLSQDCLHALMLPLCRLHTADVQVTRRVMNSSRHEFPGRINPPRRCSQKVLRSLSPAYIHPFP